MGVESRQLPLSRHAAGPARRLVFVSYCVVSGAVAVAAGALASLLVEGLQVRLAVWLATAAVVAAGAGVVWGCTPLIPRRHVERVRPRTLRQPEGRRRS
ncbi:hypothetical protein GCM10012286_48700 [Streptomyces lasiicapitis]|uniref:Uncharacterized protein n=1 Tax=Streptomyces lasiicapitis TaxID=1923961 RepID=A0ABQ2MCW7_9ACTN|nr:hypothetical protein GCM10012286_48700 [Streptomyces lasiicapitis]